MPDAAPPTRSDAPSDTTATKAPGGSGTVPAAPSAGRSARSGPRLDPRARLHLGALSAASLAVALLVTALVASWTGATDPVRLADAGPGVRWGLPMVRVVHDLAAATTIGLLVLAAFCIPESRDSARRVTAARLAAVSALLWALSCGVQVLLNFALVLGAPVGSEGYWDYLGQEWWGFDLLRCLFITGVIALGVALGSAIAVTRGGLAWCAICSLAALFPLALTGHSGGVEGHEAAVNSLLFHLVGITLWAGGLLALLALRRTLGRSLAVVARRYSTIAAWGFVLVAGSGVVNASVRVGSLQALTGTRYGLVVIAKVLALGVLGVFGLAHRRRLLPALEAGQPGAFTRFAVLEGAVMAAAIGLGIALGRTVPPVPDEPVTEPSPALAITGYLAPPHPTATSWLTSWQLDWLFTVVAWGGIGLYLAGAWMLHRRGDRWPVERTIAWTVGMLIFFYAVDGAPGVYGRVLFSAHMVMHMTLMMVIPMFLVMGMPTTLLIRALRPRADRTMGPRELLLAMLRSRYFAFWANPVVAGLNFFLSLVIFYWSPLLEYALRTHSGHVAMVVHFTVTGYLFVWTLIGRDPGPPKWPAAMRLMILFGTLAAHAFFGVALMMGNRLLAEDVFTRLAYTPHLVADQQLGGGITWGVGELPTMILAVLVAIDWVRADDKENKRRDRQADRDHDAELEAYNERLAAMARHDAGASAKEGR